MFVFLVKISYYKSVLLENGDLITFLCVELTMLEIARRGLICDSINLYFLKSPKSQVCLSRLVVKTIISQCIILFSRYIGFSFEPFSCCFLHLLFTNLSRHHVYLCSFEAIFLTSYLKKKYFPEIHFYPNFNMVFRMS